MRPHSLIAVAAFVALTACGSSSDGPSALRTVAKVTVTGTTTTLDPGQVTRLTATATDAGGTKITDPVFLVWTSNANAVATVNQTGNVTAVSAGSATITADAKGVKGTISIKVNLVGGPS